MNLKQWSKLKEGTYIKFKDMDESFYLIYDVKDVDDMPLCTRHQYENFQESYGHIFWDEKESAVKRYQEEIGTIADIELIKEVAK